MSSQGKSNISTILNKKRSDLSPEEMLKVIFDYAERIANEKELDNLLILMADMGREIIVADRCTLWLLDNAKKELWTRVAHGVDQIRTPMDAGIVGEAIKTGVPVLIDDAYSDARFNKKVDKETGYTTKSILAIPFKNNDGEIMGAFQALNKMTTDEKFSKDDVEHLTLAASYSAKSLESAMLYKEIEDTQKEIIITLGAIGENRSLETANHVKRVAEYSRVLALEYGLPEEDAELLKMASPMHDIGKVAIPDSILKKKGRLTDKEFQLMRKHPEVGYELLKNSKRRILKTAATVAHEHHEYFNGKGYPCGKKGYEIHIFGRITALADVFDALSSDRCYKDAWELERILNLLKDERNQQFEGKLVDIFLKNIRTMLNIKENLRDNFVRSEVLDKFNFRTE